MSPSTPTHLPQPACTIAQSGASPTPELQHGGKLWLSPSSLPELLALLKQHSGGGRAPRLVAGNTGAGVFCELWPKGEGVVLSLRRVREMRGLEREEVSSLML